MYLTVIVKLFNRLTSGLYIYLFICLFICFTICRIQEDHPIMSFSVSDDDRHALLNVASQVWISSMRLLKGATSRTAWHPEKLAYIFQVRHLQSVFII